MFALARRSPLLLILGLLVLAFVLSSAMAAGNTLPQNSAGDGSEAVSGYDITAIHYNLAAGSAGAVASITFTATETGVPVGRLAPKSAAIGITAASLLLVDSDLTTAPNGVGGDCTVAGGGPPYLLTCTFAAPSQPAVTAITDLRIVLAQ